jgi:N-methylhydantoinase A
MDAEAVVIGVDTGGTFTDVFASSGRVVKLPSTPDNSARAILRGLELIGAQPGDVVGHGTTVATNAVLERRGARTALITTAGFEDVLEIRRQNRPSLYDLYARWPDPLVPSQRRIGVRERLDYRGHVLHALDHTEARRVVEQCVSSGAEALAVCLLFSYVNPDHERALEQIAATSLPVSISSDVAPQYGEFERASTTVVNAYVMPVLRGYLGSLEAGLRMRGLDRLHVMHSNGGLLSVSAAARRPVQTVLSGPAAGVVGARELARRAGHDQIITFDMGGTSTDVAVAPGRVLDTSEGEVAGFPLLVPMLTIETVGAGGGSIAHIDLAGGLKVGPQSAGADPGPAAYGRGTRATVTDANLILGRLSPRGLLGGSMPLDAGRARAAVAGPAGELGLSVEQAAWAIVRLANSNMERAVRAVTLQRGYDPRLFTLVPFGGAGPLHAAEMAEELGIEAILVPPHPGVMAALGLTIPDLQRDLHRTVLLLLSDSALSTLDTAFEELESRLLSELEGEDLFGAPVFSRALDLRYAGQSFDLRVEFSPDVPTMIAGFRRAHEQRYGYAPESGSVEVVNVRVRATLPRLRQPEVLPPWPEAARSEERRAIWFGSAVGVAELAPRESRVLWRPSLPSGTAIAGPAAIEQYDSVTLLPPGWTGHVDSQFNLIVSRSSP